jgi:hypothetical protein
MVIGGDTLKGIICIACGDLLGIHSKKNYMRCIFRLQGTISLMDRDEKSGINSGKNKSDVTNNNSQKPENIKVMRRIKDTI